MHAQAAITPGRACDFTIDTVTLSEPAPDEVLVRIAGVGICHTDLLARDGAYPMPLPAVLGHEGSGVVEAVGAGVTNVEVGDHVVLTYRSCTHCASCRSGAPAYCTNIFELTYGGARPDGSNALSHDDLDLHGHFFGQSSFAEYAVANEQNAIPVRRDVPLEALGPLGCGVQTGVGAVFHSLRVRPTTSIAVFGAGAVGLSAIMGAALVGCTTIVAIDIHPARLELARELGATHVIDTRAEDDLAGRLAADFPGGLDYTLDTTGRPAIVRCAVDALAPRGTFGLIAGSPQGTEVALDMNTMLFGGRVFRGIIGGDTVPHLFIPRLVDLYAGGQLPIDKLITYYPLTDINRAVEDTRRGDTVKAVLRPEH